MASGRRDQGPKEKANIPRGEFVAKISQTLTEMQQGLFDRALALRKENTRNIDSLKEFETFFTPKNADEPEIHGGLAMCHFVESPEMDEKLKELKVTVRCVPIDGEDERGRPFCRAGAEVKPLAPSAPTSPVAFDDTASGRTGWPPPPPPRSFFCL